MTKTKLRIHTWPEKILRTPCKAVTTVDDSVRSVFDEMYRLMVRDKGVGLAANQVGVNARLVLVEFDDKIFKLVNPSILKKEGSIRLLEGCLSFPGLEIEVTRSRRIVLSALNERGQPREIEASNILAVILQHEIDHIEGKAFISRIPLWQKLKILPKIKAIELKTHHELSKQRKK
ncbi:MAG: peptide deformylase [Candidatus Omnitrophota bacterium]|nr:peptide deformylase [Candidatus Omnitrophota bacterium]